MKKIDNSFTCVLINARSVLPKIQSLIGTMNELEADLALVTETWLTGSNTEQSELEDIANQVGLVINHLPRAARVGGGVAIVHRKSRISVTRCKMPQSRFEIMATIGRRAGQRRKVLAIVAYVPPDYNADDNRAFLSYLCDTIMELKKKFDNPYIFIGGDFNRRDLGGAIKDYRDLRIIRTPPTRGAATLDLIATNTHGSVIEAGVTAPISSDEGAESDHKTVYVTVKMPRVADYKKVEYTYFRKDEEGLKKFDIWMREYNWNNITELADPHSKVAALHDAIETGKTVCFEKVTTIRKSTEPSWASRGLRKVIKRRRAVFKREGRSHEWWKLKKLSTAIVRKRRGAYNTEKRAKLLAAGPKDYFRCIRSFLSSENTAAWDIRSLLPDKNDYEVAEEMAVFFNRISNEYQPLSLEEIPSTFDEPLPELTHAGVVKLLKESKKPNSVVPGDMFPESVTRNYDLVATIALDIYQSVCQSRLWPRPWKYEYQTCIPKTSTPSDPNDVRNISCTNYLSKVLELYVLRSARTWVKMKTNQFGGEKGSGTTHMVVDIWDTITRDLEDNRSATVMAAIDYSRAFNRLEHAPCLRALAKKGAPNIIIELIASFLMDRQMSVKVGEKFSTPRSANAGAPQG